MGTSPQQPVASAATVASPDSAPGRQLWIDPLPGQLDGDDGDDYDDAGYDDADSTISDDPDDPDGTISDAGESTAADV